ncbi:MAG: diguanylate cyclase [Candidatus Omnitrophota bacterium]
MKTRPFFIPKEWLSRTAILAVVYCIVACASLSLALPKTNVSPVWPPSGIAFAAILLFGYRIWPGIALGSFLANVITFVANGTTSVPLAITASFFIGIGNALEALSGMVLLKFFLGSQNPLSCSKNVLKFIFVALLAPIVSCTIGPTVICLLKIVPWDIYLTIWHTWWSGDATGILIFTPILLTWYKDSGEEWTITQFVQSITSLALLFVVSLLIFGGKPQLRAIYSSFTFILIPIIVWTAFRFGQRGVALSMLVILGTAIWKTVHGFGPFAVGSMNESLVLLQSFIGVVAVTGLILAALLADRRNAEEISRQLAAIVDSSDDAIIGKTLNGNIISWNKGAEQLYGFKSEEVLGQFIGILTPDGKLDEASEILNHISRGDKVDHYVTQRKCKDGKIIYVSLTISPVFNAAGKLIGASSIARDVTDRITADNNLKILKNQLEFEKTKLEEVLNIEEGLNTIINSEKLIDFIVLKTAQVLDAERCSLMLIDEHAQELCIKGHRDLGENIVKRNRLKVGMPIAGQVAQDGEPILVTDIESDSRFARKNRASCKSKSFLIAPIKLDRHVMGVINVTDKNSLGKDGVFSEIDLKILCMISRQVAVAIENAKLYRELNYLTVTDPMTNMYNYRYFTKSLDHEIMRLKRHPGSLCLLMMDVDNFKVYNDTFGHQEGDKLLRTIGQALAKTLRDTDVACRYAGDEFVAILPHTAISQAKIVAEKIKRKIESISSKEKITLSIGIANYTDPSDRYDLILKADTALYAAKKNGKNKVHAHHE